MNLILSQVLNIQGTPATIIGDQMVAGAIPADELEGLVKEQLAKIIHRQAHRRANQQPHRQLALPQNVSATSLQTLDGRTLDLHAISQQKPLLLYVWATWCGVCRYTTPSVASLAADGGNVLTVALRSGDNAALEKWLSRKKMALPTVNDPSGQLARQWDIQVTPTLVVISQGEVKSITTGWT
ncbi:redoxin domain-containing protein, partial [Stenotrophomonas maltophilia]|uniref:redoxin domain-containing protein n=1 Tax=Stenotrophomonas maltophilia TaxID=40324 RepID=UPI00224F4466|nr:redoxin domain-containing protein [Stenotrophomonas maltophilia]